MAGAGSPRSRPSRRVRRFYGPRRTCPSSVLFGDLDSLTTPIEGERVTALDLGPSARWILVCNDTHVNAMEDPFGVRVRPRPGGSIPPTRPSACRPLDPTCAWGTRPKCGWRRSTHANPGSAVTRRDRGSRKNTAGRRRLCGWRPCGAAVVGDAEWRWYYGDGVKGWGLRGGTFAVHRDRQPDRDPAARRVRWTVRHPGQRDRLAGTRPAAGSGPPLTVTGPGGVTASVRLRYSDYVPASRRPCWPATIGGRRIAATMPAP